MLFWEVMVNSAGIDSSRDNWLDDLQMQEPYENGHIFATAKTNRKTLLGQDHHGEINFLAVSSMYQAMLWIPIPLAAECQS